MKFIYFSIGFFLYGKMAYKYFNADFLCHCNHTLSIDATIMVSKNYPITGEHVGIIFVTQ